LAGTTSGSGQKLTFQHGARKVCGPSGNRRNYHESRRPSLNVGYEQVSEKHLKALASLALWQDTQISNDLILLI
jgi:hypothetical protein